MAEGRHDIGFQKALARLAAEQRLHAARGTISVVLAAALAAVSILLTADFKFGGGRYFPLFAFIFFWSAVAAAAALAAVRELRPLAGERGIAALVDRRTGGGNLVAAAYEFAKGGERIAAYSPYLVAATVGRARERLRAVDPRRLFVDAGAPAWAGTGIVLGLLVIAQVVLLRGDPDRVFASVTDPALSFRFPRGYNLVVTSGSRFVLPGESMMAEAVNFGSARGGAELLVSSIPGVWNRIKVRGETAGEGGVEASVYRHPFNDVREDFSYAFSAGGVRTPVYRVTVMHRPVINSLTAVVDYPAYTKAKPDTIAALAGKIVALAGSTVELRGETSVRIRRGALRFAGGAELPLRPRAGGFTGGFRVATSDTFEVAIEDSMGLANDRPVRYPVVALEDRPPSVELIAPEDKAQLPRTLSTELLYRASDDYGIVRVELEFLREGKDQEFSKVPIPLEAGGSGIGAVAARGGWAEATDAEARGAAAPGAPVTELAGRFQWSLAEAGVFPGDRIRYYIEVFDNNAVTGPGRARTETRTLVVPSASEIYARIRAEETAQRQDLEDVLDRGKEIKERLDKLSNELKAEGELDWSRKRESGEILEKQRELREKMREIASQIDNRLDDIEKNRTASREVGEKIEQIRDLLKQIESEDLRKLIDNLQKLMSEVSAKELMDAMNEVRIDADKLMQSMDRTIELLKQVIKEEKMDELIRRTDEMLKEQSALRDSTPGGDTGELSKRQDTLGKQAGDFRKDMENFARGEGDTALASELEKMLQDIKEKALEEQMKQAAEELSGGDRTSAQCSQSKAMDGLLSLYTSLGQCQMSMGMALDREVTERLVRSARELVEVSKIQEGIEPRLREPFGRSASAGLIKDELVVGDALRTIADNIAQAARKTMILKPKVFIALGAAQQSVEAVLKGIEDEQPAAAAAASGAVYRNINVTVIELLRASSSTGGSRPSARQMMQQLMQEQLSLSQELRRLLEGSGGERYSMEERARMARLAGEQRKMEELVKQIAEESAGTGELMGKLDDVVDKMEQVAKELEEGALTNDLVERQEQILTRMLDSQRSMRERDYKRERTSTTAGDMKPLAPDEWSETTDRSEVILRMIRRAMQERGPAEYDELIRQYFRALSEKVREVK
jgi:hypothetical protein